MEPPNPISSVFDPESAETLHSLPREAMDVPSLGTRKVSLDRALSSLISLEMSLLLAEGLN